MSPTIEKQKGTDVVPTPNSRAFSYIQYDEKSQILTVSFKNGSQREHQIDPQTYQDFKLAPSKGKFYFETIAKVSNPL